MNYIDLHCDTLMMTWKEDAGETIVSNKSFSVDFERLKKSGAYAQFFAIFMLTESIFNYIKRPVISDDEYIESLLDQIKRGIEKVDYVKICKSYDEFLQNKSQNIISAFLTLEDGRSVNGDLKRLDHFYEKGIRLITLTWNNENCIGFPNSKDPDIMNKGLKPFGIELIEHMNKLGVIIDVSHLSDGGFYDVAKYSKKPFTASHSNSRILSPHTRNMTDDMIKVLADKGGIMGLNLGPEFLNEDITNKNSTVALMVKHLNHQKNIGGIEVLALGSDFDGVFGNMEINGCDKYYLLFDALKKDGWMENEIEMLAYKNAERFLKDVLK
ncbi:dipeptidase [Treponema denticola]